MEEEKFYNALNILLESNYQKLSRLITKHKNWTDAWKTNAALFESKVNPDSEWKKLEKTGIELILAQDSSYPHLLLETQYPPHGLYILGQKQSIQSGEKLIGIVGTRKASQIGKEIAQNFAQQLGRLNFSIVSGLAIGIDTEAHLGALEVGAKTFAVIATGLDQIYPKLNSKLWKKILDSGGAILSEYPIGSPAMPYRFLERNRIVAGLSDAMLVIEAPEKSGSLVTARLAAEGGRTVYVTPGPISHPNYRGSHALIRDGATLVTHPREIIEEITPEIKLTPSSSPKMALSPEETLILETLKSNRGALTIDKIIELTNLNAKTANQAASLLLIQNLIKETELGYTI